jgi:DNA-binding transcriptional regulator YiaG
MEWDMTPERFRQSLELLEFSPRDFAAWVNANDRMVRRWASGAATIPDDMSQWLEGLARYLEVNPRPRMHSAQWGRTA